MQAKAIEQLTVIVINPESQTIEEWSLPNSPTGFLNALGGLPAKALELENGDVLYISGDLDGNVDPDAGIARFSIAGETFYGCGVIAGQSNCETSSANSNENDIEQLVSFNV